MISGLQIRAARGFLAWDRRDLAKKSTPHGCSAVVRNQAEG
jgi:hypothetical protein